MENDAVTKVKINFLKTKIIKKKKNIKKIKIKYTNRSTANKEHVQSKFGTGSLQTLSTTPKERGTDTRKALIEFYEQHYSANVMKLCVLGQENLETLEKWVREKFSEIKNKNRKEYVWEGVPYTKNESCKLFHVVPVKDLREIRFCFLLPSQEQLWREKPTSFLTHLLGHEAEGSILYHLKQRGLGNG